MINIHISQQQAQKFASEVFEHIEAYVEAHQWEFEKFLQTHEHKKEEKKDEK